MLIKEEWVHSAVDYLMTSSADAASAKGAVVRADYERRRIRAQMILRSDHKSAGLREADAESSREYAEACQRLAEAEESLEYHRNQRNKATLIIEAWRSQEASKRVVQQSRPA